MRIVIFWDSISEWFWDYKKGGWVNMLKVDLWKKYWYGKMLMNYWIEGYTSCNIITVFQHFFDACSRMEDWKEEKSIVVIAVWINDCSIDLITKKPRVNKEYFEKNINILINKCKEEKLINKVWFIGNTNVDEKIINNADGWEFLFYNSDIEIYNGIVKKICNKNDIEYIDVFWLMKNDDLEDGIHPNTKWHTKIFKRVKNYLT